MYNVSDLRYDTPRPSDPEPGDRLDTYTPPRPDEGYDELWDTATVVRITARNIILTGSRGETLAVTRRGWTTGGAYPVTAWLPEQRDEVSRRVAAWGGLGACSVNIPYWLEAHMDLESLEGFASAVAQTREKREAELRG